MKNNSVRQVKLQGKWRPGTASWLGKETGKEVPWLSLSGLWLAELGFHVGDNVSIVTEANRLVIERVNQQEINHHSPKTQLP